MMINEICVSTQTSVVELLTKMDAVQSESQPRGILLVVDNAGKLLGTITDGDIRRHILKSQNLEGMAADIMNANPITFNNNHSAREIIELLPGRFKERKSHNRTFLSKVILVDDENVPSRVIDYHELWEQRVATHRHIVIAGLGYVGLTLALALSDEGFHISGYDVDQKKIKALQNGDCYIHEVGLPELLTENLDKTFIPTSELPKDGDVYIISVGTPVVAPNETEIPRPIMDYLHSSIEEIGKVLNRGNLVVLRSTVPIGTCRSFVIPKLEEVSGLKCGLDFHVSFAPERTAEGKAIRELRELPQIIGGYNDDAVESTVAVFRELTSTIVRVESLEAAEMIKLVNNSFRDYVFAYANELSQLASRFNIDVIEAIKSANKGYPRNPIPLPSPGVGGPCLTKDPFIFANVAKEQNMDGSIFIESRRINESMHMYVIDRLIKALEKVGKSYNSSKVLICGLAFKGYPETGDIRNSSSVEVHDMLVKDRVEVLGYDPVALMEDLDFFKIKHYDINNGFDGFDAVLFMNNHRSFERIDVYSMVRQMNDNPIIFDGWSQLHRDDVLKARPSIYMNISATYDSLA